MNIKRALNWLTAIGGTISGVTITGSTISSTAITPYFTTATDPAANAAVSAAVTGTYDGIVVTLTGAGNAQTMASPTVTTAGKIFTVINNDTSGANTIAVNGFTITSGEAQSFIWDGSAWGPVDLGITSLPVPVAQGGTGLSTITDGAIMLGSATGAVTPLADVATGQVLASGGVGADPAYTATPTLTSLQAKVGDVTANTIRSLIDEETEASSDTLTANQCSGGLIDNIGMGANDVNYTLPAVAEGYNLIVFAGEPSANYLRVTAPLAGSMVVDGVPNKTYASLATPAKGNYMNVFTAKCAPGADGILTGAALAQGSTTTAVANGAFTFYIAGTKYADAADAVGVAPGNDVIPQSKYGCVAFDIGTDGTLDAIEASDNATGYDSAELAVAGLPAVAASHVRTGYVTAIDTGDTFIFGTDDLATAGTITVAFTSTAAYTAVFNWIVTTGAGTVTSG